MRPIFPGTFFPCDGGRQGAVGINILSFTIPSLFFFSSHSSPRRGECQTPKRPSDGPWETRSGILLSPFNGDERFRLLHSEFFSLSRSFFPPPGIENIVLTTASLETIRDSAPSTRVRSLLFFPQVPRVIKIASFAFCHQRVARGLTSRH